MLMMYRKCDAGLVPETIGNLRQSQQTCPCVGGVSVTPLSAMDARQRQIDQFRQRADSTRRRLGQNRAQNRDVVTQRLTRGSRCHDHHMAARKHMGVCLGLVDIRLFDAPLGQHAPQPVIHRVRELSVNSLPRWHHMRSRDDL